MIARALLLASLTFFSVIASATSHLVAGAEIAASPYERQVPRSTYATSAMATDGDRILAATHYDQAIQGTLIDRNGRVLNADPIPILTRTETAGARDDTPLRVLWFRDHYVVLFIDVNYALNAVRVTADGKAVDRTVLSSQYWGPFDAATDGNEIVIVNTGAKVRRLDANLRVDDTLELQRLADPAKARAVTFGAGRFVIVTVESLAVTSQSLENGTLGPIVKVAPISVGWSVIARATFTGSTFAAAWTECDFDYDRDTTDCIGAWTPLAPDGKAAGPVRVLGYNHIKWQTTGYPYDVTMTALDDETLFFTWRGEDPQVAAGRRYRITGAAMGDAVSFGPGPLAPVRTSTGALAVLDSRQMLTWIDSAATASIPNTAPATPALLRSPDETIFAAAASATEVGVLRKVYLSDGTGPAELSILARDGSLLRNVRLSPASVLAGALASDGSDFFALTCEPYPSGKLTFHDVRRGTQRVLAESAYDGAKLAWNGAELIATWRSQSQFFLARLDRDGRILGQEPLDSSDVLALAADANRILLVDIPKVTGGVRSQLFDAHGRSLGQAQTFTGMNSWAGVGLATNGETDALAMPHSQLDTMTVAFRPRNGTFVPGPTLPNLRYQVFSPALAPAANGSFLIAWSTTNAVLATTTVALLDRQGFATSSFSLLTGYARSTQLVPLDETHVLFIYTRVAEEPRYAGATRVFTRVLTIDKDEPTVLRGTQRQ